MMKRWLSAMFLSALTVVVFMGCEGDWSTGGGADSWSTRYNWVNFSGVYRGVGGGKLVTDYSTTPGTPGTTNRVSDRVVGTTTDDDTSYSGTSNPNVVPGSFTVRIGGFLFVDDGRGTLTGGHGGTIEYGTGRWAVNLPSSVGAGQQIRISYLYAVSGSVGSGSAGPGSSRVVIYSFVVEQSGNILKMRDNTGAVYEGNFGDIRTTGGVGQDTAGVAPEPGDQVIAQFEARGTSAAGYNVTIVGTFQGVVQAGTSYMLMNRSLYGTWIEDGGRTGDINGQASPIQISVSDATGTSAPTTTP